MWSNSLGMCGIHIADSIQWICIICVNNSTEILRIYTNIAYFVTLCYMSQPCTLSVIFTNTKVFQTYETCWTYSTHK